MRWNASATSGHPSDSEATRRNRLEGDMTADDASTVTTAVVVVHGMGEQRPMETLDGFVKTALRPRMVDGVPKWDYYYSRPAEITGSYEARRHIAPRRADVTGPDGIQGQTEIYEYHWSYLMGRRRRSSRWTASKRRPTG